MANPRKDYAITEHTFTGPPRDGHQGHTTYYQACGPVDGAPVIFVHGWPERAISWRHVMPTIAGLGFRCYAPDMRGYGNSSVYKEHSDYRHELIVKDLLELADHVGAKKAVWIGHDWGSPAVAAVVAHHPDRVHAAGFLCVPYFAEGFVPSSFLPLVDKTIYPEAEWGEWGQWDYQRYYEEDFTASQKLFDKDPERSIKLFFRAGDPAGAGKPALTAGVRKAGGWFGGVTELPDLPLDESVISPEDLKIFTDGLKKTGFFGGDSWYMNHAVNGPYAKTAPNNGVLNFPVLMIHARYDYVCETVESRLMEPMRRACPDLTEFIVDAGHWVAQEKPMQTSSAIAQFLARKLPELWVREGIVELKK